jgi:6-phosphogluconate dehydrogenase
MNGPKILLADDHVLLAQALVERPNWARAIAMVRHEFGGHPYGANPRVAAVRRTRRVGGFEALLENVPVE